MKTVVGKSITILRIRGIKVSIDLAWVVPAIIIAWLLAEEIIPFFYRDLTEVSCWCMGAAGVVSLLISILWHELSHCLASKIQGLPARSICISLFGGISEMDEPSSAKKEFLVALAGPLGNILLAILLYAGHIVARKLGLPVSVCGILLLAVLINVVIAVFNLLPALPLDGGHMLHSVLWASNGDSMRSACITMKTGFVLSIFFFILGVVSIFTFGVIYSMGCAVTALSLWTPRSPSCREVFMSRLLADYVGGELRRYKER
jgi:Zn-dependent protease